MRPIRNAIPAPTASETSSVAFRRWRSAWLEGVMLDARLTPSTKVLAGVLATRYADGESGEAWPSQQRLASDLGVCVRTVRRAIEALRFAGWIEAAAGCGRGLTTLYRLLHRRIGAVIAGLAEKMAQNRPAARQEPRSPRQDAPPPKKPERSAARSPATNERRAPRPNPPPPPPPPPRPAPPSPAPGALKPRKNLAMIFVPAHEPSILAWNRWLRDNGYPGDLAQVLPQAQHNGIEGFRLPSRWPPRYAQDVVDTAAFIERFGLGRALSQRAMPSGPAAQPAPFRRKHLAMLFVRANETSAGAWEQWLIRQGYGGLEKAVPRVEHGGTPGYRLPSRWPPPEDDAQAAEEAHRFIDRFGIGKAPAKPAPPADDG